MRLTPRGQLEIIRTSFRVEDDAALRRLIEVGLERREPSGILPEQDLRYLRDIGPEGNIRLAFVERGIERQQLAGLRLNLTRIGIAAILGFLVLAWLLAQLVLRPVRAAWLMQTRFIEDASHELKTPLAVLSANLGLVQARPEATVASQNRWLSGMAGEIEGMNRLVTRLLTLARFEQTQLPAEAREPVALSRLCEASALAFASLAFELGKPIEESIAPGLMTRGNADELRQLIGILLENALRYGAAGSPVRLSLEAASARQLRLSVHNWGEAIPPQQQAQLFDRFYRASAARAAWALRRATAMRLAPSPARAAASAWAWPSPGRSPSATAASCGSRAPTPRARPLA